LRINRAIVQNSLINLCVHACGQDRCNVTANLVEKHVYVLTLEWKESVNALINNSRQGKQGSSQGHIAKIVKNVTRRQQMWVKTLVSKQGQILPPCLFVNMNLATCCRSGIGYVICRTCEHI